MENVDNKIGLGLHVLKILSTDLHLKFVFIFCILNHSCSPFLHSVGLLVFVYPQQMITSWFYYTHQ